MCKPKLMVPSKANWTIQKRPNHTPQRRT
jgi:hypothetical protein